MFYIAMNQKKEVSDLLSIGKLVHDVLHVDFVCHLTFYGAATRSTSSWLHEDPDPNPIIVHMLDKTA